MTTDGIQSRPVGRILRLLLGIAMVLEAGRWLIRGSSRLLLETAGVIVGAVVFYALLHIVIQRFVPSINRWLGAVLAVMPVFLVYLLSDAPGKLGSVMFVGISLLLTAIRNDGGCEVMTLPGMLFRRRTHLVCVAFSPIDWVEQKLSRS